MKKSTLTAIQAIWATDETITTAQRQAALSALRGKIQQEANMTTEPLLLNCVQSARKLGISKPTLWRLCKSGDITPVWVRGAKRFRLEDLERLAGVK